MYAMNIQNDVICLVLRENCKSKQVTDFIAWPSRCHDTTKDAKWWQKLTLNLARWAKNGWCLIKYMWIIISKSPTTLWIYYHVKGHKRLIVALLELY